MKRTLLSLTLAAAFAAGCGNYSNEDVDFQLALPAQEDLEARLPGQALSIETAPEYYRATRGVIAVFNGTVDIITRIVDYVRSQQPSARSENRRVWGPFANSDDPAWQNRMVMVILPAPGDPRGHHIDYSLDFRRAGAGDDAWLPLITGKFYPTGGARRGRGEIRFDLTAARALGYPTDPRDKLLRLEIAYNRSDFPVTVDLRFENIPGADTPGGVYQYMEDSVGAGSMLFGWRVDNIWAQALEIRTRWRGDGAGRADARVTEGVAAAFNSTGGIDCWGIDAQPTYFFRSFGMREEKGVATDCVFAAP